MIWQIMSHVFNILELGPQKLKSISFSLIEHQRFSKWEAEPAGGEYYRP